VPLDISLPHAGTLLFFYFDGQYDSHQTTVGFWEPATLAGARVLHVGPGEATSHGHAQPASTPISGWNSPLSRW